MVKLRVKKIKLNSETQLRAQNDAMYHEAKSSIIERCILCYINIGFHVRKNIKK